MNNYTTRELDSQSKKQQLLEQNYYQNTSQYLLDRPTTFHDALAVAIGLNEAIFLAKLHELSKESKNVIDGFRWIYNSFDGWVRYFPYWTPRTIRKAAESLKAQGLIFIENHNKMKYDRTFWYRVNYVKFREMSETVLLARKDVILPKRKMDVTKTSNGCDQNVRPIPLTNTNEQERGRATLSKTKTTPTGNERAVGAPGAGSAHKAESTPTKETSVLLENEKDNRSTRFEKLSDLEVWEICQKLRINRNSVLQIQREFLQSLATKNVTYGARSTQQGVLIFARFALKDGTILTVDEELADFPIEVRNKELNSCHPLLKKRLQFYVDIAHASDSEASDLLWNQLKDFDQENKDKLLLLDPSIFQSYSK